ncbi:MAG: class I mannose-6-phosphate isomerase [Bacteroidales bacterium]|nr:class I mannose-6-phosphate isomerase [Bacteroidales bacterium]
METTIYPLKFLPLFKNKVWGGNKIKTLGFDYAPLPNCGEMWVLSAVKDNESVITNGFLADNTLNDALEIYMGELIGEENYRHFGNDFPLLIKIIDANDKLSIQVHPDNKLARERGMENGKTEMWYIMEAEQGAEIVDGFEQRTTAEAYQKSLKQGTLEQTLHVEHPQAGDVFFIPAGRVHALGKGLLLAEIQQSSDTTYRIYDYNRPDANGKLRELHTAEALAAIDFAATRNGKTHYNYQENSTVRLAQCPYFTTNLIALSKPLRKDFAQLDSFVVYLCTDGIAAMKAMDTITPLHAGECVLVPAAADRVELFSEGPAKLLEVYVDPEQWVDEGGADHYHDLDWVAKFVGEEEPEEYEEEDWEEREIVWNDNDEEQ